MSRGEVTMAVRALLCTCLIVMPSIVLGGCQFGCPSNGIGLADMTWRWRGDNAFRFDLMPYPEVVKLYASFNDSVYVFDDATGAIVGTETLTPERRARAQATWRDSRDTFYRKVESQIIFDIEVPSDFEFDSLAFFIQRPLWRGEFWDYCLSMRERSTGEYHYVVFDRCEVAPVEVVPHGTHHLKLRYRIGDDALRRMRAAGEVPPQEDPTRAGPHEVGMLDLNDVIRRRGR